MTRRDDIPLLSIIIMAAVPAVLLGGLWQYAEANEPPPTTAPPPTTVPPPPAPELTTDLMSMRRHPTPIAKEAAAAEEERRTAALADDLTAMIGPTACVTLRRDADVLYDVGGDRPLIPASNMKLPVAAVALAVLGRDFRFRTELQSSPPVDGVVTGDVYLVGGGDPVLVTSDYVDPLRYPAFNTTVIDGLADQLVTAGVARIEGDIVGDGSRYDDEFRVPTWSDAITNFDAGPYDALLVNDGSIGNGNFGIVPAQSAANIMLDLIRSRGITVTGSSRNDPTPADAGLTTLALVESAPLTDVLVEMLHTSDNNTAELLLKEIGVRTSGQGTRAAGAAAVAQQLATWGVRTDLLTLVDGSGLSRDDRLTCEALSSILATSPVADELWPLLPVAARDGTLADQFVGTPADGELVAKTGTLTGVKALSGVMDGADDRPIEFSLLLNGDGVDQAEVYLPYWNEVVDLIGRYPVVVEPDVAPFEPR